MQKKLINEYDSTKNMLNTLRKLNESKYIQTNILKEQSQEQRISTDSSTSPLPGDDPAEDQAQIKINNDITVINDVDVKMLSSDPNDMGLQDQQKQSISTLIDNFRQQVSQIAEFKPGMVINQDQIRLDGSLPDYDMKFTIIAGKEMGTYVNAEMLKLDSTVTDMMTKLYKFETTFKQTLEPFITQRQNN